MTTFTTVFLALVFEAVPFLLAGVALSAILGPLVERVLAMAAMRQPVVGIVAGSGAGMMLPMCDCGSRPLSHRLAAAGHHGFAVAFLVAAPVVNPIVIVTTWLAFRDADLVVLRLGLTAVIAWIVGLVVVLLRGPIALPLGTDDSYDEHDHNAPGARTISGIAGEIVHEFAALFPYLVAGAALAAGVQVFIDQDVFTSSQSVYLLIAAMMGLSFLLSICSSVDAFVAAGLASTLGTGPILAFLTFGPIVNLKSMPMYLRLFALPIVIIITIIATQLAFVTAVLVEFRGW